MEYFTKKKDTAIFKCRNKIHNQNEVIHKRTTRCMNPIIESLKAGKINWCC